MFALSSSPGRGRAATSVAATRAPSFFGPASLPLLLPRNRRPSCTLSFALRASPSDVRSRFLSASLRASPRLRSCTCSLLLSLYSCHIHYSLCHGVPVHRVCKQTKMSRESEENDERGGEQSGTRNSMARFVIEFHQLSVDTA